MTQIKIKDLVFTRDVQEDILEGLITSKSDVRSLPKGSKMFTFEFNDGTGVLNGVVYGDDIKVFKEMFVVNDFISVEQYRILNCKAAYADGAKFDLKLISGLSILTKIDKPNGFELFKLEKIITPLKAVLKSPIDSILHVRGIIESKGHLIESVATGTCNTLIKIKDESNYCLEVTVWGEQIEKITIGTQMDIKGRVKQFKNKNVFNCNITDCVPCIIPVASTVDYTSSSLKIVNDFSCNFTIIFDSKK